MFPYRTLCSRCQLPNPSGRRKAVGMVRRTALKLKRESYSLERVFTTDLFYNVGGHTGVRAKVKQLYTIYRRCTRHIDARTINSQSVSTNAADRSGS